VHPHAMARLAHEKRIELLTIARVGTQTYPMRNVRTHRWRLHNSAPWLEALVGYRQSRVGPTGGIGELRANGVEG
jgi:hypothetical protein